MRETESLCAENIGLKDITRSLPGETNFLRGTNNVLQIKRFKKRLGCCAFLDFSFWFLGSKLITPMRIDHQKFSRTVELNVQGTTGVQKRVPFPQKRFF